MKQQSFIIFIGLVLIGGYLMSRQVADTTARTTDTTSSASESGIMTENGQQIVPITVRGGYSPESTVVQPGIPTVIRFVTRNTFDCSSAVRIPSLDISKNLPPTGTTDIPVGTLQPGQVLQGSCAMGMYQFEVQAQK